jgi:hypothetical protein
MKSLLGKKILYIGVSTFGYEKEIKSMLEKMGAVVDYHDERPSNDFWTKVFLRLNMKKLIDKKINSYYDGIIEKTKDIHYDYVFVIKLETIDKKILEKIKASQKEAKFILYLWDSIKNYKGKDKLLPYFDKAFSFDSQDVKTYDKFTFLPLFYIPIYEQAEQKDKKYDLCFIGSGHSDRYQLVKDIEHEAIKQGLSIYAFFFLESKKIFLFRKIFDKRMRKAPMKDFSFQPMSQKEILDTFMHSSVVVDIEHPGQVGLTMRTIEMIGCKKKLITTNKSIKEYDFYDENNICIVDRSDIKLPKDFFKVPYQELDKDIYEKYSLKNWLKTIF